MHACVCIYICIINIHSTHAYVILTTFWMRLITINRLTALKYIRKHSGIYVFMYLNNMHWMYMYMLCIYVLGITCTDKPFTI